MTELEFSTTSPRLYGEGNINLLVSSSVSGSERVPIPPYTIQGLTIPFTSQNEVNVKSALQQVESVTFQYTGGDVKVQILSSQKRNGYFYLQTDPVKVNSIPTLSGGDSVFSSAEFIFAPYFQISYYNNDYNPLINNSNNSKVNSIRQVVDRRSSQAIPTNLPAILSSSAELAQVQNCSYTKASTINARYDGTKETSRNIPGNEPAVGLRSFKAENYPLNSDTTTIKNTQLSDRIIQTLYFNAKISGSHPNKTLQTFPSGSSFIYVFETTGSSYSKAANLKVYSTDKNQVYITNEFGQVIGTE